MNTAQHTKIPNSPASEPNTLVQFWNHWSRAFASRWAGYTATIVVGVAVVSAIALFIGSVWLLAALVIAPLIGGIAGHIAMSSQKENVIGAVFELEQRLLNEASASRVLGGIKLLNNGDSSSSDARLAAAARMATGYPAAVVFTLRAAHGVLALSNWNYDGQLSQIREEFEPIDGDAPGASAARQGSAIVISASDPSSQPLPAWAEHVGFTQGIVVPITRGLDTIGVVYVLNKSIAPPKLNEIEQLELIVSFSSAGSSVSNNEASRSHSQPFRVVEKSAPAVRVQKFATTPIRMAGFALNPELERMEMDGTLISLSPTEFLLMHTLASSPDRPVSPIELMDRCWTKDSRPADNAVDVAIFRLRKKLNRTAAGKGLIKTVRGNGYMFVPPMVGAESAVVAD